MNKVKLIIIMLAFLMIGLSVNAQKYIFSDTTDMMSNAVNSTYIFEGKICGKILARDNIKNGGLEFYKVLITAIYKNGDGKLKLGTVFIIDRNPPYSADRDSGLKDGTFAGSICIDCPPRPQQNGVYFCSNSTIVSKTESTDNGILVLEQDAGVGFVIENNFENGDIKKPIHYYNAFGKRYFNREDFYLKLSKYPNVSVPDSLIQKKLIAKNIK